MTFVNKKMASKDQQTSGATAIDTGAIYHDVSPTITLCLRLFNCVVLVMTVIAFVLCLVKGNDHQTYYLLACNTVISSLIGIVVNWWYRGGDLGAEKYWYIFLVGVIILFQCVTTDIYVFHVLPTPIIATTTAPIPTLTSYTTHNPNITGIYNISTIKP